MATRYMLINPVAMITDLDLIRQIFTKDFNNFVDRGLYSNEDADPLTAHLFNMSGEPWRKMRHCLTPTFTGSKIKGMFHIIESKGSDLVEFIKRNLHAKDGIRMKELMTRFTADVVALTSFGLETKALQTEKPAILEILMKVFGGAVSAFDVIRYYAIYTFPGVAKKLKMKMFSQDIHDFFESTIRDAIDYREKNNVKRSDFLNMLINLKNRGTVSDDGGENPEGKLTFNQVLAQAFIFFAAGYDTSSNTMGVAAYYIAKDPVIQKRLREEIQQCKAAHDGKLDYDALSEMTYLNNVLNGECVPRMLLSLFVNV